MLGIEPPVEIHILGFNFNSWYPQSVQGTIFSVIHILSSYFPRLWRQNRNYHLPSYPPLSIHG